MTALLGGTVRAITARLQFDFRMGRPSGCGDVEMPLEFLEAFHTLGFPQARKSTTSQELKAARDAQCLKWHPDKNPMASDEERRGMNHMVGKVMDAYNLLSSKFGGQKPGVCSRTHACRTHLSPRHGELPPQVQPLWWHNLRLDARRPLLP